MRARGRCHPFPPDVWPGLPDRVERPRNERAPRARAGSGRQRRVRALAPGLVRLFEPLRQQTSRTLPGDCALHPGTFRTRTPSARRVRCCLVREQPSAERRANIFTFRTPASLSRFRLEVRAVTDSACCGVQVGECPRRCPERSRPSCPSILRSQGHSRSQRPFCCSDSQPSWPCADYLSLPWRQRTTTRPCLPIARWPSTT